MTISKVSTAPSSTAQSSDKYDAEIQVLEKEKTMVNDQINKEKQSDDDEKTKRVKIAEYEQKISLIESKIRQAEAEKLREKTEKSNSSTKQQEADDNLLKLVSSNTNSRHVDILA